MDRADTVELPETPESPSPVGTASNFDRAGNTPAAEVPKNEENPANPFEAVETAYDQAVQKATHGKPEDIAAAARALLAMEEQKLAEFLKIPGINQEGPVIKGLQRGVARLNSGLSSLEKYQTSSPGLETGDYGNMYYVIALPLQSHAGRLGYAAMDTAIYRLVSDLNKKMLDPATPRLNFQTT